MFPPEKTHPKSFEVMAEVLERGDAKELAHILSRSPQLIRDWQREVGGDLGTGRYNPLDRVRALIWMVCRDDNVPARAYPIGHYIARLLGGLFVPMPPAASNPDSQLFAYISDVLKETTEAVEVSRVAWCEKTPGRITSREAVKIKRECEEAMGAIHMLMQWANQHTDKQ